MKWAVLIGVFLLLAVLFVIAGSPRDIFKTKVVASHEVSAIVNLRLIAERQDAFRRTHNGSFADALPLLDGVRPIDYGYAYSFQAIRRDERGSVTGYVVTASPTVPGQTGVRYFSMDETGFIRWEAGRPTDAQSPSLKWGNP
jgi:hypothetical protein